MKVVAAAMLALTGCATIIHGGGGQDVGFSSSPTGAQVMVDGNAVGKTPVVSRLSRGQNHIVRIELPGYAPYEATLTKQVSGWVWGNIAFGGLIGLAVDAISGGLYNLTPEQMQATLAAQPVPLPGPQPASVSAKVGSDSLVLAVVLAPDPNWQKIGQLEAR